MKTFKKILWVLVILLAIPLIVALFLPKKFAVEKTISIDKSKDEVYTYLSLIKNQDQYGVWQLSEPEMQKTYTGTDGTVGFVYSWEGKKVGKGKQTITKLEEGKRIETELDFGMGDPAQSYFEVSETTPSNTLVTWGITGTTPYPFNLMTLFYDMGKDFDQGLANLKEVLEKN